MFILKDCVEASSSEAGSAEAAVEAASVAAIGGCPGSAWTSRNAASGRKFSPSFSLGGRRRSEETAAAADARIRTRALGLCFQFTQCQIVPILIC